VKEKISSKLSNRVLTNNIKLAISKSKGSPILVKCLTDNTEIEYSSMKKFEQISQIKYSTIKKYLDTNILYSSKKTKKEYLIFSIKKDI